MAFIVGFVENDRIFRACYFDTPYMASNPVHYVEAVSANPVLLKACGWIERADGRWVCPNHDPDGIKTREVVREVMA